MLTYDWCVCFCTTLLLDLKQIRAKTSIIPTYKIKNVCLSVVSLLHLYQIIHPHKTRHVPHLAHTYCYRRAFECSSELLHCPTLTGVLYKSVLFKWLTKGPNVTFQLTFCCVPVKMMYSHLCISSLPIILVDPISCLTSVALLFLYIH